MKTTIYELLGMIKDGKAPKRFLWKDEVFTYSEEKLDYVDNEGDWLFIDYTWQEMLNDTIEILETTLNTKDMNITGKKIEKLNVDRDKLRGREVPRAIDYILEGKINEIIDYINGE